MKRIAGILVVVLCGAFNWNGKTVTHEVDLLDGRMKIRSGHPLAGQNAFNRAATLEDAALERVLGEDYTYHRGDALQLTLFGGWLNEVRTNLDMGGSQPLELAAGYLEWRYRDYLDGRIHSDRWSQDTAYSSSNYQHSMMVSWIDPEAQPIEQDDVFDLIDDYVRGATISAIANLIVATKAREEGSLGGDAIDASFAQGLFYVGSVFHLVEDSAVSCTTAAQRHVSCLPGDGHVLLANTPAGIRVVTLSDNAWYERHNDDGDKPHGLLDDLYREDDIAEIYGNFDPALANGRYLASVARAVSDSLVELRNIPMNTPDGLPNDEFDQRMFSLSASYGREIAEDLFNARYAPPDLRQPLPLLPGPADTQNPAASTSGCTVTATRTVFSPFVLAAIPLILLGLRLSRKKTED